MKNIKSIKLTPEDAFISLEKYFRLLILEYTATDDDTADCYYELREPILPEAIVATNMINNNSTLESYYKVWWPEFTEAFVDYLPIICDASDRLFQYATEAL